MSLYEVTGTVPGNHLVMKDLVRGGDPIRVEDRRVSRSVVEWDRFEPPPVCRRQITSCHATISNVLNCA